MKFDKKIEPWILDLGIIFSLTFTLVVVWFNFIFNIFSTDWNIPIADFGSDFLPLFFQFKSLIKGDWGLFQGIQSQRLGYPFGADWIDYPMNHSLYHFIIKFLSLFNQNWAVVFNLYWFFTYFLSAFTFALVSRMLGIKIEFSIVLGILYSFLPHHLFRLGHLWLASYFMVPFQVYFLLLLAKNDPTLFSGSLLDRKKQIFNVLILIVSAWTGIYYLFFFCVSASAVAIIASIGFKSYRPIKNYFIIILISVLSLLIDSIPYIIKNIKLGNNGLAFQRHFPEAEYYGLKLIHLLLPHPMHRIDFFKQWTQLYNSMAPLITENHTISLGLLGGFGFLISLIGIFLRGKNRIFPSKEFGELNVFFFFLGTIGGFGALIAFFAIPEIRAYNRIVVFISCVSLFSLGKAMSNTFKSSSGLKSISLAFFLLIFGFYDQISPQMRAIQPISSHREFISFYNKVELIVGEEPVLQLPVIDFPDGTSYNNFGEYESLRPYLFTEKVRLSFGNVLGRYPNSWLQNKSFRIEEKEMLRDLKSVGFRYLLLSKRAYVDNGSRIQEILESFLGKPVLENDSKDVALYSLEFNNDSSDRVGYKEEFKKELTFAYGLGIFFNDTPIIGKIARIPTLSPILLFNPRDSSVFISFQFKSGYSDSNQRIKMNYQGKWYEFLKAVDSEKLEAKFNVPPGRSEIYLQSSGGETRIMDIRMIEGKEE